MSYDLAAKRESIETCKAQTTFFFPDVLVFIQECSWSNVVHIYMVTWYKHIYSPYWVSQKLAHDFFINEARNMGAHFELTQYVYETEIRTYKRNREN